MALEAKFFPREIPAYLAAHGGSRALTPDEESVLYLAGERLLALIVDSWPVDTGTSQDAFSFYVSADPAQGFGVVVENPMFYAEYVHLKDTPPTPELWKTLFPAAWAQVKPGMLRALFAEIDRTEAERARREQAKDRGIRKSRYEVSRELSRDASPFAALRRRIAGLL